MEISLIFAFCYVLHLVSGNASTPSTVTVTSQTTTPTTVAVTSTTLPVADPASPSSSSTGATTTTPSTTGPTLTSTTTTTTVLSTTDQHVSTTSPATKPTVKSRKVPNPEVGVRVVIIFLAIVAFIGISLLVFFLVRRRRRRSYQQPSRNSGLRTAPAENTQFDNPIQFPSAAYGNAVI